MDYIQANKIYELFRKIIIILILYVFNNYLLKKYINFHC